MKASLAQIRGALVKSMGVNDAHLQMAPPVTPLETLLGCCRDSPGLGRRACVARRDAALYAVDTLAEPVERE